MERKNEPGEFTFVREFDAPRERVFQAFTEARYLAQWWGPVGYDMDVTEFELAPGGRIHYRMKKDDHEMWGLFRVLAVTPPASMVFILSFSNKEGAILRPPFEGQWPLEMHHTIMLESVGDRTRLTLTVYPLQASSDEITTFTQAFDSMNEGYGASFNKLVAFLPSLPH